MDSAHIFRVSLCELLDPVYLCVFNLFKFVGYIAAMLFCMPVVIFGGKFSIVVLVVKFTCEF